MIAGVAVSRDALAAALRWSFWSGDSGGVAAAGHAGVRRPGRGWSGRCGGGRPGGGVQGQAGRFGVPALGRVQGEVAAAGAGEPAGTLIRPSRMVAPRALP